MQYSTGMDRTSSSKGFIPVKRHREVHRCWDNTGHTGHTGRTYMGIHTGTELFSTAGPFYRSKGFLTVTFQ